MSAEGARVKPNLSGKRIELNIFVAFVIICILFAYFSSELLF